MTTSYYTYIYIFYFWGEYFVKIDHLRVLQKPFKSEFVRLIADLILKHFHQELHANQW